MRETLIKTLIFLVVAFLIVPVLLEADSLFIQRKSGNTIVLNDSSKWYIHSEWQHHLKFWNLYDRVTVCPAIKLLPGYRYVLVKDGKTLGIPARFSQHPLYYRKPVQHAPSILPYLYRERERRDNQGWDLLKMFWVTKQLKAQREQNQQQQEQRQPRKELISIDESSVVYISTERNLFHKEVTCPFLKRDCRVFKTTARAMSVRRAKELGCVYCIHCFGGEKRLK